jgi:hypothetical protein
MPSFNCSCGHRISYGEIPCKDEWLFISDTDFDSFAGLVDAEKVYSAMRSFLRCPSCRKLWFFWEGFGKEPQGFAPIASAP